MTSLQPVRFKIHRDQWARIQALAKAEEVTGAHLLRTAVASYLAQLADLGAFDQLERGAP